MLSRRASVRGGRCGAANGPFDLCSTPLGQSGQMPRSTAEISSYSLAWVGVLALLPVGSGYVLTTNGATCAAGLEITSLSECEAAIAAANTRSLGIGKTGIGKAAFLWIHGTAVGKVDTVSYSFKPKGCSSGCYYDWSGYFCGRFNTHATGSGTGTDTGKENYLHCLSLPAPFREPKASPKLEAMLEKTKLVCNNAPHAVVARLIEAGASPGITGADNGETVTMCAVGHGQEAVVAKLVAAGACDGEMYGSKGRDGEMELVYVAQHAAGHRNETVMMMLIEADASVNARDGKGRTMLMRAAGYGQDAVVTRLIKAGALVDANDSAYTALLWAAVNGHATVVTTLIEAGVAVSVNTSENDWLGKTALLLAAGKGHVAVVARLLEAGVPVNAKSAEGHTAMHYAASHGHAATVVKLIEAGASVDVSKLRTLIKQRWLFAEHGYEVFLLAAYYLPTIVTRPLAWQATPRYIYTLTQMSGVASHIADTGHWYLQALLSPTSIAVYAIAALLEFLRLHYRWSALVDTALDRATAPHVIVAINVLQFPFRLLTDWFDQAFVVLISLTAFRGARDISLRVLRAYREDGKCAAAKAVLADAVLVIQTIAWTFYWVCRFAIHSGLLVWVGEWTVLLLAHFEVISEHATVTIIDNRLLVSMVYLLLRGLPTREDITDWVVNIRTSLTCIRRRVFRRPAPVRPPSAGDVCPICLDDFLLDTAPVQCDAPGTHGLWQFAASEWQFATGNDAAASSVGIDEHLEQYLEQPVEYCRWGCGQPVHKECMRAWTRNHRNECVICQAWWG